MLGGARSRQGGHCSQEVHRLMYRLCSPPWGTTGQQLPMSTEEEVAVGGARAGSLEEGAPSRAWKLGKDAHSSLSLPSALLYG